MRVRVKVTRYALKSRLKTKKTVFSLCDQENQKNKRIFDTIKSFFKRLQGTVPTDHQPTIPNYLHLHTSKNICSVPFLRGQLYSILVFSFSTRHIIFSHQFLPPPPHYPFFLWSKTVISLFFTHSSLHSSKHLQKTNKHLCEQREREKKAFVLKANKAK